MSEWAIERARYSARKRLPISRECSDNLPFAGIRSGDKVAPKRAVGRLCRAWVGIAMNGSVRPMWVEPCRWVEAPRTAEIGANLPLVHEPAKDGYPHPKRSSVGTSEANG